MADLKHIYVDDNLVEDGEIKLDKGRMHYISRVLRLQDGALFAVFNGRDGLWEVRLDMLSRNSAVIKILRQLEVQPDLSENPQIEILFAPIKKHRLEILIEKSVELGVLKLCPILTEYTDRVIWKEERIMAQVIRAAEQCGRLDLPEICEPRAMMDVLADLPSGQNMYFCAESGEAEPLLEQLILDRGNGEVSESSGFILGPEGGFSEVEMEKLRDMDNVKVVSLGKRILRAETAAMVVLGLWQAVFGEKRVS